MPRIFDNIALSLLPALSDILKISDRTDFCVGYFNLRGWKLIDQFIDAWPGGKGSCCRLIVGMPSLPQEELRQALSLAAGPDGLDAQAALRLKKRAAEEFRAQLMLGAPNNEDEAGLRRLSVYSFRMMGDTLVECYSCRSSEEDFPAPGTWSGARQS